MSWHTIQGFVGLGAGILSLAAFVPYVISTIRKPTTRPNRATWWIWTLVGVLIAYGNYAEGVRSGIWLPISYIIGPTVLAIVSLRHGEGGWTRLDRFCLLGALLSIVFWTLTRDSLGALLVNILIDALGALPTIKKSYRNPEAEDPIFWYLAFAAALLNLFAVESSSFSHLVYPVYMVLLMGTVSWFEFRPRFRRG